MCCCQKTAYQNSIESDCMSNNHFENPLLKPSKGTAIKRSDYEKLWDMLRHAEDGIIVRDVPRTIPSISYDKAKAWLAALDSAGYVSRKQIKLTRKLPTYRYTLIRDIGQEPPRIDSKGAARGQSMNEVVWRTARILKTFNANQIIASGNTPDMVLKPSGVRQYLRQLYLAGYLQLRVAGQAKQLAVYQLLHDTGPKAPQVKRGKKVYDGNLDMIVYDPETPLPPSHQAEKDTAKQTNKGARHA